jgi:hypothetical protein
MQTIDQSQIVREVWTCPSCRSRTNLLKCPHCDCSYNESLKNDAWWKAVAWFAFFVVAAFLLVGVLFR